MKQKFPYGYCDFERIITDNYFYQDRTDRIQQLEDVGNSILLLRPRRFGKSLLLSMLENYYDLAKADKFETLFGHLAIGQTPTPHHNQYFVMKWDFSMVDPHGDVEAIIRSLYNHINSRIINFANYYQPYLKNKIEIDRADALFSFNSLLAAVQAPQRLYLLIDEYDNFANEVMVSRQQGQKRYEQLLQGEGTANGLYFERLQKILLPKSNRNEIERAVDLFYSTGDLQPVCDLVEQRFSALDNRDYKQADELLVKTAFLAILFNDLYYMINSETALQRGYADLTMILRSYQLLDHVVEFKYVSLKEVGLSGAQVRELSREELRLLPAVQQQLSQATTQLARYRVGLTQIYGNILRLQAYGVVSIGFERMVWQKDKF